MAAKVQIVLFMKLAARVKLKHWGTNFRASSAWYCPVEMARSNFSPSAFDRKTNLLYYLNKQKLQYYPSMMLLGVHACPRARAGFATIVANAPGLARGRL